MAKSRSQREREPKSNTTDSRASPDEKKLRNWADEQGSRPYKTATKLYTEIARLYENKQDQNRNIEEYWKIYHAQPDENLQYMGNSQGYVPAVRDCINSRAKRALKQLFPVPYRHVEAVGTDPKKPYAQLALIEHYIRRSRLKDIVRSDLVAGDVTGQWNLYIDWTKTQREITKLVKRNPVVPGAVPGQQIDLIDPTEEEEVEEQETITDEGPDIVDVATEDVAVLPPTCTDIEKSEASSVILRLSQESVQRMVDEGVFILPGGVNVKQFMAGKESEAEVTRRGKSPGQKRSNEAGIHTEGTLKYLACYEVATMLEFEKGKNSLGLIYYGNAGMVLGIIKAPWWGGKRPLISASIDRVQGSFFGISKIEPVKFIQWQLTDFWNMGQDSAMYSMLPIIMTDPLANPNWQSMVIGLAAVWGVDPSKTKFAEFPQLWKESANICEMMKRQIWESMDVNEMMMGRTPQGRKNNALIGAMQQEAMIGVMDHAERYEEVMLNRVVERLMEYDAQFRTESVTVVSMGEIGVKAKMTEIEPQQWGARYDLRWTGTSIIAGAARMQQQIAAMNVLRGIPPQQLNGRKLDICPVLEAITESVFGPEVAPRILIDERNLFTIPPEVEDEMMVNGLDVEAHEADDDIMHLRAHQRAAQLTGDPVGKFRVHIAAHVAQIQRKRQMMMAMAQQGRGPGMPGMPGPSAGGPAVPGAAGTPRLGSQPGAPRLQGPPGMQPMDGMVDPSAGGRG